MPFISNRDDGHEVENGSSRLVRFLNIGGEVEWPFIKVVGVDEGLVGREAVFGEMDVGGVAKSILEVRRGLSSLVQ